MGRVRGLTRSLFAPLACLVLATGCALPRWPVDGALSSGFGLRLRGGWPDVHRGVDFPVPTGTPVRSMSAGTVRYAGWMRGFGNVVWIDHPWNVMTVYAHLSAIHVAGGDDVDHGAVIGLSGASGDVTAPHLHFEVWRSGRATDPVPLLGGEPGR